MTEADSLREAIYLLTRQLKSRKLTETQRERLILTLLDTQDRLLEAALRR